MSELNSTPPLAVAEVQGLFGPVSLSERIFQKIWHRGDFRSENLQTLSGKRLEIISRGKWNKLAGPDFLDAELRIDGARVLGDIEFHFYAEDWNAHGHDKNPQFGKVILHVLLFPSQKPIPTKNAYGNAMESFLLLPHLNIDVEDYASAEALSALEGRKDSEEALELLLKRNLRERENLLTTCARERFEQKVRFMRSRLEKNHWEKTLHEVVLETLGLRRNRSQMSKLALKFSPSAMMLAGEDSLFKSAAGSWSLSGVRPANHPKSRLRQYLRLLEKNPSWARELLDVSQILEETANVPFSLNGKRFRADGRLPSLHKFLAEKIFAGSIGGTRFETLICDAVLPLISARKNTDLFPLWYHWFLGDAPTKSATLLKEAELISRERPLCNGAFQGLLQIFLTRESTQKDIPS